MNKETTTITPKPWGYVKFALSIDIKAIGQKLIAVVQSRNCSTPEEMLANGQLIAASPELLEAAEMFLKYMNNNGGKESFSQYFSVYNAIEKAHGIY